MSKQEGTHEGKRWRLIMVVVLALVMVIVVGVRMREDAIKWERWTQGAVRDKQELLDRLEQFRERDLAERPTIVP